MKEKSTGKQGGRVVAEEHQLHQEKVEMEERVLQTKREKEAQEDWGS